MKTVFTSAQMEELKKFERFFRQVRDIRQCSYPGDHGVQDLLRIWTDTNGERKGFRNGCYTCIIHLVRDIGTLYFAQLEEDAKKAAEKPAESKTPAKVSKTTATKKTAAKPKQKTKK